MIPVFKLRTLFAVVRLTEQYLMLLDYLSVSIVNKALYIEL